MKIVKLFKIKKGTGVVFPIEEKFGGELGQLSHEGQACDLEVSGRGIKSISTQHRVASSKQNWISSPHTYFRDELPGLKI